MDWTALFKVFMDVGVGVVREFAVPWLDQQYGSRWRQMEEKVREVADPIFAAMAQALAGEGLAGMALHLAGGGTLADDIVERIYDIRRPYQAQATRALQALGLEPGGN